MSCLFVLENGYCKPNEETLLISPFKEIWENDETTHKEIAIKYFSFIELYASKSVTNPYAEYSDDRRFEELNKAYLGGKYNSYIELPEEILEGIQKVEEFQENGSSSMRLYKGLLYSVDQLINFLYSLDMNEKTSTGAYAIKPVDVLNNVAKAEEAIVSLNKLKENIQKELFETSRTRAGKKINPYERV